MFTEFIIKLEAGHVFLRFAVPELSRPCTAMGQGTDPKRSKQAAVGNASTDSTTENFSFSSTRQNVLPESSHELTSECVQYLIYQTGKTRPSA